MPGSIHVPAPLPYERLRPRWPEDRIPWKDSSEIPRSGHRRPSQPRALAALELACRISDPGYNVYLSGEADYGRTYLACEFLDPLARRMPAPPDLVYVTDFDDEDSPLLIELPAGQGRQLRDMLENALKDMASTVASKSDSGKFLRRKALDMEAFRSDRNAVMSDLEKMASGKGFALETDDQGGLSLVPLKDGRRMQEDELRRLDEAERQSFKARGDALLSVMTPLVHRLSQIEKQGRTKEKDAEKELVMDAFRRHAAPVAGKVGKASGCEGGESPLGSWFAALERDVSEHTELFLPSEQAEKGGHGDMPQTEGGLRRYEVNLFVDNGGRKGAPVVVEDHPTFANLLGCIERESEMGSLVTDFTLLRSGSIHRANGGFLIIHAADLLKNPQAWEGLIRTLRAGASRVEDPEAYDSVHVRGIKPVPVPLNVKVILVGDEELYEELLACDERFSKLFKVKAHLAGDTELTAPGVRAWLIHVAKIIDEADLLPFDASALARIVDYGTELCEDRKRISLRFPLIREALIESSAAASAHGALSVGAGSVAEALAARRNRSDMLQHLFMEEYDRDLIKIRTSGSAVGRVNGLAVMNSGDYEFGLPHRISCVVGVGHGGVIDLEREAELGGPIHTKAMMILKSFLIGQFAWNKPLVLTGSLYFEQSYTGIEGDSASGAELAALLSALAGVPLRQSLAFTGAVSQTGQILAVGGVTRKIEGFFELCARRGLTGGQGVIIPHDNIDHLMLEDRVAEAVKEGKFAVYPVTHITEALELLTGMPAGRRTAKGFSAGTLFGAVDARLVEMGRLAEKGPRGGRKARSAADAPEARAEARISERAGTAGGRRRR